jgi:hypothetical protein
MLVRRGQTARHQVCSAAGPGNGSLFESPLEVVPTHLVDVVVDCLINETAAISLFGYSSMSFTVASGKDTLIRLCMMLTPLEPAFPNNPHYGYVCQSRYWPM